MVSLGPDDYGMPADRGSPRLFLVCIGALILLIAYLAIDAWLHPEESAAALQSKYEQCDPSARFVDRWGRPNCDFMQDMKAKGKWPPP